MSPLVPRIELCADSDGAGRAPSKLGELSPAAISARNLRRSPRLVPPPTKPTRSFTTSSSPPFRSSSLSASSSRFSSPIIISISFGRRISNSIRYSRRQRARSTVLLILAFSCSSLSRRKIWPVTSPSRCSRLGSATSSTSIGSPSSLLYVSSFPDEAVGLTRRCDFRSSVSGPNWSSVRSRIKSTPVDDPLSLSAPPRSIVRRRRTLNDVRPPTRTISTKR